MTNTQDECNVPADVEELVSKWIHIARSCSSAHTVDSLALARKHKAIGSPSVALSAIVSTSIFASLQEASTAMAVKWILASLSMAAACLAALVTFYNFAEKSTRHKVASEEYMAVARALEIIKTSVARMPPKDWRNLLDGYSQRLEAIGTRVDLPTSMRAVKEIPGESYRMFPQDEQQNRLSKIVLPELMHVDFPQELMTVHTLATKQRCEKGDTLDKA